ncbi:MAG TPA: hypothetical protein VGJ27_09425 [Gaiellaceae bacterium]
MEEACRRAARPPTDHEDRVLVPEPEERVECHHEAALGIGAAPVAGDRLQLGPELGAHLPRPEHLGAVAGPLETVYGLSDLADRATIEREALRLEHGLVAVVESVQAAGPVEPEAVLGRAEDRQPPAALAGEGDEQVEQPAESRGRPDRIAGDDRDPADHAIGEERALVLREVVRLVRPQDERRERVRAPGRDEVTRQLPLPRLLAQAVAPRPDPAEQEPTPGGQARDEDRERKPAGEVPGQVRRAAKPQPDERRARLPQDEAQRDRLVDCELVQGERRPGVGNDPQEQHHGPEGQSRPGGRITGRVEVVPPRDQAESEQRGHSRSDAEAVQEVKRARAAEQHERDLPGTLLAPHEAGRSEQQRQGKRPGEGARERVHAVRGERSQEAVVV